MHYISYLHPFPPSDTVFTPESSPVSSQSLKQTELLRTRTEEKSPVVVLGGYSYGSLILKHLPPVPSILHPFSAPLSGSAAAEILLRAHKLADQSNLEWINLAQDTERQKKQSQKKTKAHENKLSVTMGGEETSPEKRRSSREIRRSLDGGRSLDFGNRFRSLSHRRRKDENPSTPPSDSASTTQPTITMPQVRYLLISPLTPPISTLAAPALGHKFWHKPREEAQEVIGKHASLAIFGDQDIFSSAKKTRDWVEKVKSDAGGARFESVEVAGAGHFWHEAGVEERFRDALREWEGRIR